MISQQGKQSRWLMELAVGPMQSTLIALVVAIIVAWATARLCERHVLLPFIASQRRGAWARDERYWAVVKFRSDPAAESDDVPLLIPADALSRRPPRQQNSLEAAGQRSRRRK